MKEPRGQSSTRDELHVNYSTTEVENKQNTRDWQRAGTSSSRIDPTSTMQSSSNSPRTSSQSGLTDTEHNIPPVAGIAKEPLDYQAGKKVSRPNRRRAHRGLLRSVLTPSNVWNQGWHSEHQREEAYAAETFDLFRKRLRLVATIGLMAVLLHSIFYLLLSPAHIAELATTYIALCGICVFARLLGASFENHWCNARFSAHFLCAVFGSGAG
jgi:hypothetical protein